MAGTQFVFELTSGVYIDANGNLHPGAPQGAAKIYKNDWKVPFDAGKVRDALKDVKEALNGLQKDNDFLLALRVWTSDEGAGVLKFIKAVSALAGTIAPVFAAVAVLVQIAQMFKLLGGNDDDQLKALIEQRFQHLAKLMVEGSQQQFLTNLSKIRSPYLALSDAAFNLLKTQDNLSLSDYLSEQKKAADTLRQSTTDILQMFDAAGSWQVLQDESQLTVWKSLQSRLFAMTPEGAVEQRTFQPGLMFDDRPMVPFVAAVTTSYLTCLRTLSPEYRSTSEFFTTLNRFADGLEALAAQMRRVSLVRTVYRAEDFAVNLEDHEVLSSLFSAPKVATTRWAVGALDLPQHDDRFIKPAVAAAWQGLPIGAKPKSARVGCMDFAWSPPARLTPVVWRWEQGGMTFTQWRIDNPQECADAANAQSARDYANLLVLSGHTQLLHLAALCRHEATEPDVSQSVSVTRQPLLIYSDQTESKVTVESRWTLDGKRIRAEATAKKRGSWASVRFSTQPIKRARPLRYRIALRTLPERQSYSEYFRPRYELDPDFPRNRRLVIDRGQALGSKLILGEWTPTPGEGAVRSEGKTTLLADTYNWYEPVPDAIGPVIKFKNAGDFAKLLTPKVPVEANTTPPAASSSAASPGLASLYPSETAAVSRLKEIFSDKFAVLGEPPVADPNRIPRERVRQQIEVKWTIDWDEDELLVSIYTGPEARSVRVFVVVEEQFLRDTNNVMETAVEMPMDGLVSLVPQKFFDDEKRAMLNAAKEIAENIPRYPLEVGSIHPPGPVELQLGLVDPIRLEQSVRALQAAYPKEMARLMDPGSQSDLSEVN